MSNISLRVKLLGMMLAVLTGSCFLILLAGQHLLRDAVYTERQDQTRELVDAVLTLLNHYHAREQAGFLSREEAQYQAQETIRAMRFGEGRQNYFWINDFHPRMLLHPLRPDMEGQELTDYRGKDGRNFFMDITEVCRSHGKGHVRYQWQYFSDEHRIEPKLSYVALFVPWDWIVGTGVYTHDVQAAVNRFLAILLMLSACALAVALVVSIAFSRMLTKPIMRLTRVAKAIAAGDYRQSISESGCAEVASLSDTISAMASSLETTIAQLRDSETMFRSITENTFDMIALLDMEGRYRYCNHSYREVLGYEPASLVGTSAFAVVHPEFRDRTESEFRGLIASRDRAGKALTKLLHASGQTKWVEHRVRVLTDEQDAPQTMLVLGQDVTEQRSLEAQMRQAQKMESVGRLAGGVAHDFNNMLQSILGHADLALEAAEPGTELHGDLLEIQKSAQRSADLTNQLLAFARKQTVSPRVVDLNEIIAGMVKMLRRLIGENIELVWTPAPDLWPVRIDPIQVDQILANLAVNARDAISGSGMLSIVLKNVIIDESYGSAQPECIPGDYVMLVVSDTGAGMDDATKEHLFEPFYTTKAVGQGTGLGLATIYGIVKQNRGFINVYSEPGCGTTFNVYFPRDLSETVLLKKDEEPESATEGSETILLLEDDATILSLGEKVLARHGYTVLSASSPECALALAQDHNAPIHLLVSDVVMPGMNGKEAHARIAAIHPEMRVLFVSGYTADIIAHHGIIESDIAFLQKPFSPVSLVRKVREVLDA